MRNQSILLQNAYGSADMRRIFHERNMVQKWMDFESAISQVQAELGLIPQEAADEITRKSTLEHLTPEMINEFKVDAGHLIVSLIKAFAKMCGPSGEHYHVGPTTQDILDTGLTLQIREAYDIIFQKMIKLEDILLGLAEKHKHTVMMGRTHGQHAVPITFGFKVAVWAYELRDCIERFKEMKKRLFVMKLSAACGTRNTFVYLMGKEKTHDMVKRVAERLGLGNPPADLALRTDRFAECVNNLALLSTLLGKAGLEVRDLQRTEFGEVEEPWDSAKQYSSSTMPNKRNPEPSEWQHGLSKLARANALVMMDISMSGERDATRMGPEMACIPDTFGYADAALNQAVRIFGGLVVHADRMKQNLYLQKGIAMSEVLMLKLWQKTGKKVTSHTLVHDISMKAFDENKSLKEAILENEEARTHLTDAEIEEITNPEVYYGDAAEQVDFIKAYVKERRKSD
ncbi:MAG: adenylosuccinate lyase family protein [Deltaproteobacteria bacterium]|nr:adenylosuccinate lyase family protein [Deltaproteobacteria bacterium]